MILLKGSNKATRIYFTRIVILKTFVQDMDDSIQRFSFNEVRGCVCGLFPSLKFCTFSFIDKVIMRYYLLLQFYYNYFYYFSFF